jgi:hypothetical protein
MTATAFSGNQGRASSFEAAWADASPIEGWLTESEARHLYAAALCVEPGECLVEIGAYRGRSTVLLAHTGHPVITVDVMRIGKDEANAMTLTTDDVAALRRNLGRFANVCWLQNEVSTCSLPGRPIGLLYIDGNHQYPSPLRDFEHFQPALAEGAKIAFHDYPTFEGVKRTVGELEGREILSSGNVEGSMYVSALRGQKVRSAAVREEGEERASCVVRGFHLVALCHRFGLRGRAFATSIAQQVSNPYPIVLTVFYNEPHDADLILQGALKGADTPGINFVRVPSEHIMRRASHYFGTVPDPRCSHTVFLDADLWFPPHFWRTYGEAIGREAPGYWSCRVTNIKLDGANELITRWCDLSEEVILSYQAGERHSSYQGRVGHFQCIPSGLVEYPNSDFYGVNRWDEVFAERALHHSIDKRSERRIGTCPAYHFDHPWCWTGSNDLL